MAKRSAKADQLIIKGLSEADQQWLAEESARLGCDPENLVRMMIRQRSAFVPHIPSPPPLNGARHEQAPYYQQHVEVQGDDDLDHLMAEPPQLFETAPGVPTARPLSTRRGFALSHERQVNPGNVIPYASTRPYPRGGFDAFTETEFVGLNQSVIGSNSMGDGTGNVLRQNLGHFGVAGARSR